MVKVFEQFKRISVPEREGFQLDSFLGTIVRREFREETKTGPFGTPEYPPESDPEYLEWVDLLESVLEARETYTMVELGAGFGRWGVRGAYAASEKKLRSVFMGVEADPIHFQWMRMHCSDNFVMRHLLIDSAVTDTNGIVLFASSNRPSSWYGQAIVDGGSQSIHVHAIRLSTLLEDAPATVDLIDMDIQGEELRVVYEAIAYFAPALLDHPSELGDSVHSRPSATASHLLRASTHSRYAAEIRSFSVVAAASAFFRASRSAIRF